MAKRLFVTGLAVCAVIAMQGCGAGQSDAKAAAQEQAQRGNAEIIRNKQIRSDLEKLNIQIEKTQAEQNTFAAKDVRMNAHFLSDQDLQRVQSLLTEYITNAADVLTIINSPGITYAGDSWVLARDAANARVALRQIQDEIQVRGQKASAKPISH